MKTKSLLCLLITCTLSLTACGLSPAEIASQTTVAQITIAASWTATPTLTPAPTFTPTATATQTPNPDPCLQGNLPVSLETFNEILTRFDSVSGLAFYQTRKQLSETIPELQSLRQVAEDQATPSCLETLRDHQLKYMNLIIEALSGYIDGKDMLIIHNIVIDAHKERKDYSQEMTSLLSGTPIPEAE